MQKNIIIIEIRVIIKKLYDFPLRNILSTDEISIRTILMLFEQLIKNVDSQLTTAITFISIRTA